MAKTSNWSVCEIACCVGSVVIGVIVFLATRGAFGGFAALLFAAALGVILYVVLSRLVCGDAAVATPVASEWPTPKEVPAVPKPAAEPEAASEPVEPAAPAAAREAAPEPAEPAAPDAPAKADRPAVTSGTLLPGEEDLSARKGVWRYQGTAPAATAAPAAATEGGVRPEGLAEARGGKPDDLKQIKGVGPKLEQLLHEMGYFHFDQIAAWGPEEIAWIDENLQGFRGRVSRDDWVAQAKILAEGGETEFSRRVEDGDVY